METATDVTIWLALWAGVISFISPCTLPLYPAYLSYITGVSVKDLQTRQDHPIRMKVMVHTVFFLVGISVIFLALGLGASYLGLFLRDFLLGETGLLLQRLSGILIIIIGLFLTGFLKLEWLMRERRFQFAKKPVGYLGTIFVGMGFAAGWTPCIGPIFASILVLAANNPSQGFTYTLIYILGFSLPFLGLSFFIGSTRWILKYSNLIMKIGGIVLIIMGVLLYTGQLARISIYINQLIQGTWLNLG